MNLLNEAFRQYKTLSNLHGKDFDQLANHGFVPRLHQKNLVDFYNGVVKEDVGRFTQVYFNALIERSMNSGYIIEDRVINPLKEGLSKLINQ